LSSSKAPWFELNKKERIAEISRRRSKNETFENIAEALLGTPTKKSTVWSWAKRNMERRDLYPSIQQLPSDPYRKFTEVEQWTMYDRIEYLYPQLNAITTHILEEITRVVEQQEKFREINTEKFSKTAGFLDELEKRIQASIQRNLATFRVQSAAAPSPPRTSFGAAPPPPPPPSTGFSPGALPVPGPAGTMADLRTDFEEMEMEEISALPPDFLEALTPTDRGRIQSRVKELKMIAKMDPDEREAYLKKKLEEKERAEASEGLGSSLTSMLDDDNSLFARMRRSADESGVSGTGTFGKFTTEYYYIYCIACGKTNRSEDEALDHCEYCQADIEHLVADEEKSDYSFFECLTHKKSEYVDLNYTRGTPIVILSRWKTPIGKDTDSHGCPPDQIRDITSSVQSKADPDKQFSHYLAQIRLYTQLKLLPDLLPHFQVLLDTIQEIPDSSSKEVAITNVHTLLASITGILLWITDRNVAEGVQGYGEIQDRIDNLQKDIEPLSDSESPQELRKASDIGSVISKADQLLNRFTQIILEIESELIIPSKWKCSSCDNVFELKDRNASPDKCEACGKIITQLLPVD
jgi:rRNA maturation endonuclease Nob1